MADDGVCVIGIRGSEHHHTKAECVCMQKHVVDVRAFEKEHVLEHEIVWSIVEERWIHGGAHNGFIEVTHEHAFRGKAR